MENYIKALSNNKSICKRLVAGRKIPVINKYQKEQVITEEVFKEELKVRNLGIVSGRISNLTIIDFDLHKKDSDDEMKEELKKIIVKEKLRNIVKTPNGGLHLYFKYTNLVKQTQSGKNNIDARNTAGGYVVSAGSKFYSNSYKVYSKNFDIPKMSKAFLEFLKNYSDVIAKNVSSSEKLFVFEEDSKEQVNKKIPQENKKITIKQLEKLIPGLKEYNFSEIKTQLNNCDPNSYDIWLKTGWALGSAFNQTEYSDIVYKMYENWASKSEKWNDLNQRKTYEFYYKIRDYEGIKITIRSFLSGALSKNKNILFATQEEKTKSFLNVINKLSTSNGDHNTNEDDGENYEDEDEDEDEDENYEDDNENYEDDTKKYEEEYGENYEEEQDFSSSKILKNKKQKQKQNVKPVIVKTKKHSGDESMYALTYFNIKEKIDWEGFDCNQVDPNSEKDIIVLLLEKFQWQAKKARSIVEREGYERKFRIFKSASNYVYDINLQKIVSVDQTDRKTIKLFNEEYFGLETPLVNGTTIDIGKLFKVARPVNSFIHEPSLPSGFATYKQINQVFGKKAIELGFKSFTGAANTYRKTYDSDYSREKVASLKKNNPKKYKELFKQLSDNVLVEHIDNVIMDKKDKVLLIKFLAHAYQRPEIKQRFSIILSGEQGSGKDTITNSLINLFGSRNASSQSIDSISTASFNEWKQHSFVVFSETDTTKLHKTGVYKAVKEHITGKNGFIEINPKYGKKFYKTDSSSIIMNTNYLSTDVYMDVDDRRYYPMQLISKEQLSKKLKGKETLSNYFARINKGSTIDEDELMKIANFFMFVDLKDHDPNKCPWSDLKQQLIQDIHIQEDEYEYAKNEYITMTKANNLPLFKNRHNQELPIAVSFSLITKYIYDYLKRDNTNLQRETVNKAWARRLPHLLKEDGYVAMSPQGLRISNQKKWSQTDGRFTTIYIKKDYKDEGMSKSDLVKTCKKLCEV